MWFNVTGTLHLAREDINCYGHIATYPEKPCFREVKFFHD